MIDTQTFIGTLVKVTCCMKGCGVTFGLESGHRDELAKSYADFYCPNGHQQHYDAETEEDRLRRELVYSTRSQEYWKEKAEQSSLSNRSLRGVVTRTKRRIGNGVCPCCKRTFRQLADHIKTKHPDYMDSK